MFFLIAGLGNPGQAYRSSRHNVGFEAVERLAERCGIALQVRRFSARLGLGRLVGHQVCVVTPQTYMNLSGAAVGQAAGFYQVPPERLAVLHDDMDLELGRIQVRRGGSDGGHRGVRSVIEHLGTADFVRLRLGVGRPVGDDEAVEHVLSPFEAGQQEALETMLGRTAEAVETWIDKGLAAAMNRYNPWKRAKPAQAGEAAPGTGENPGPGTTEG